MASIYERPDSPFLWMAFKHPTKGRVQKKTAFKKEQRAEAEEAAKLMTRREAQSTGPGLTVAEWANEWFEHRENTNIKSVKDDRSRIKTHVLPVLGAVKLSALKQSDIQALFDRIATRSRDGKISSATVRCIHSASFVMLKDAFTKGHLDHSQRLFSVDGGLALMSQTLPAVHKKATLPYSLEEVHVLLSSPELPEDRRILYTLAFYTGARFGEVAALRWQDIEERSPMPCLHINKAWSVSRKVTDETKTGTVRQVPVHPALAAALRAWRQEGFALLLGREPLSTDLIIPSRRGVERNGNHALKRLRQDLTRAGIPAASLHKLHAFRTTFISELRSAGVDKEIVRSMTHGLSGDRDVITAFYTKFKWPAICDAVCTLDVSVQKLSTPAAPSSRELPRIVPTVQGVLSHGGVTTGQTPYFESRPPRHFREQNQVVRAAVTNCTTADPEIIDDFPEPLSIADILTRGTPLLRSLITVRCESCKRTVEVEDGPGIWDCIFCGAKGVRVEVDALPLQP